jgi:translocator protein
MSEIQHPVVTGPSAFRSASMPVSSSLSPLWGLLVSLLVTFAFAAVGGIGSSNAPEFYAQLHKPAWAPPAWLFGPAWTVLYTLMAVAAWRVWQAGEARRSTLWWVVYGGQLSVNALWSWLFFAFHLGGAALADSVLLWLLLCANAAVFWRIRPLAGALMLPSIAWVSFATVLNAAVWQLNPVLLR